MSEGNSYDVRGRIRDSFLVGDSDSTRRESGQTSTEEEKLQQYMIATAFFFDRSHSTRETSERLRNLLGIKDDEELSKFLTLADHALVERDARLRKENEKT